MLFMHTQEEDAKLAAGGVAQVTPRKRHKGSGDLNRLRVAQLRVELGKRGAPLFGVKPELVARLKEEMDAEKKKECTIFVGNVPVTVTKKELRRIFAPYGKIQSIRFRSVAFAFPKRKNGDKKVRLRWCVCVCGGACAVVRVRA